MKMSEQEAIEWWNNISLHKKRYLSGKYYNHVILDPSFAIKEIENIWKNEIFNKIKENETTV